MKDDKTIRDLFNLYLHNQCTQEEIKILLRHFNAGENEALLKALVRQQLEEEEAQQQQVSEDQLLLNHVFKKVKQTIAGSGDEERTAIIALRKRTWLRVAVAASILVFIATTVFLLFDKHHPNRVAVVEKKMLTKEIVPGLSNAILTLSDGSTIVLDSAANGDLAQQGATKVIKLNGQIVYNHTKAGSKKELMYNSIATARGNQYAVILSDGTKVWLNASSSLRFPIAFVGMERRVEVSGEAYFEVAKDPTRPFKVNIRSAAGIAGEVEVLGTHFNINAYDDEKEVKTTLLEGAVKIQNHSSASVLAPGQQAKLTSRGISISRDIDLSQVVAWKEGYFQFDNTDLPSLMRQVSRWYDVDVFFEGKAEEEGFSGKIPRSVPLSKFLKVLQLNDVQIKVEGRKLIIQR